MRAIRNPPNPWTSTHVEWIGEPPPARLEVYEEEARSVVAENDSPDVPFRYSVNPYRGCLHGCAYCYARPTHQYLGFGAGTDFDRKIVVKLNAPEALRREIARPSFPRDETLTFSGVTDCYQPLEASYGLTRRCLQVCEEVGQRVAIITKGMLVRRDLDVLAALSARQRATLFLSIPFADDDLGRTIEPYASWSSQRFETLRLASEAGVPTGIAIAPLIPGLNDRDIPSLLERARKAGATWAFTILLRLPAEVLPVFEERLREAVPLRADRVLNAVKEMRGGKLYRSEFGSRMRGEGPRWEATRRLFEVHCRRLGLNSVPRGPSQPPPAPGEAPRFRQATIFDAVQLPDGSGRG